MRFRLYREHGALNSVPVFNAFEQGVKSLGHEIVTSGEDVSVIWSVLWSGTMSPNREIYNRCRAEGKSIIILEVGSLERGTTWRVSIDHINRLGIFGNSENLDPTRPEKLGVQLKPLMENRRGDILIATQHNLSHQWDGMPILKKWTEDKIAEIRQFTKRRIVVRPHPRAPFPLKVSDVVVERPQRIPGSYDNYNIFYGYHCVINHNSGPAVQAAINGVPVVCDSSSLAYPVSDVLSNIENIQLPDRTEWFLKLCHTEWTVPEIAQGLPLSRLLDKIS